MDKIQRASRKSLSRWGWKAFLIMAIGALLLTGCEALETLRLLGIRQEWEITFYKAEKWELSLRLIVPPEAMETELVREDVESEVQAYLQEKAPGVKASWRKEQEGQNTVYYATFEGEGWHKLNEFFFDGNASISRREGKLYFSYPISPLEGMLTSSVTLRGGKIISSNADEITDGSAIWYHPAGTIEAVLTEKGGFNWLVILLALLGLSAIGGTIAFITRRKTSKGKGIACPKCGMVNRPGAKFCKRCGAKL